MTDYFLRDVGITQNQFNVGQQLLSAGIVLLEVRIFLKVVLSMLTGKIPSNYVLYRIGPTLWIGGQILAWCIPNYHRLLCLC